MWGWNAPALDVDFLMVEYDAGKPKALIEYKHELASEVDLSHASYRAVRSLAIAACIPFFVCRYTTGDEWTFTVTPACNLATTYYKEPTTLSEESYVELLYKVRGRVMPEDVKQWLRRTA